VLLSFLINWFGTKLRVCCSEPYVFGTTDGANGKIYKYNTSDKIRINVKKGEIKMQNKSMENGDVSDYGIKWDLRGKPDGMWKY